jgi:WhiB family transcriptional regulator, redox-sensing transcriptional regulator
MPTALFYPLAGQNALADAAKLVCAQCPVLEDCLADALRMPVTADWGVRGGMTEQERQRERRRQKKAG